ncbi:MAG: THUMP domain-containing protein [Myxococcota bacterium]|nr:THUMP domain-containing protein [Myxococcota bacterium]
MPTKRKPSAPATHHTLKLFATTAAGLEDVLAEEIQEIGGSNVTAKVRGVGFYGDLNTVYRANLWLRTAHRVLVALAEFEARDREALYANVRELPWHDHLSKHGTLAVDAVASTSEMNHTRFISQVIKDAIVDKFRDQTGTRPSVDANNPDLRLNARLRDNHCTLSLDTSGTRLHRRGYRSTYGIEAPLKETLAAGILLKSGYSGDQPLVDPMCGSGTFLIEGALIARNIAPGLLGRRFGFMQHPDFDRSMWQTLIADAKATIKRDGDPFISGSDISEKALRAARAAAQGVGVDDTIRLRRASFEDQKNRDNGMVVTNPPYGERLGEIGQLADLYSTFGDVLKKNCQGMTAHILTSSKFLAGRIGLRSHKRDILWNGPLECRLLHFRLY